MICVPLDDVEDVLQRKLEFNRRIESHGRRVDVGAFLLDIIDELTALQIDTEARMCPECGDPPRLLGGMALGTHCRQCHDELAKLWPESGVIDECVEDFLHATGRHS